MPNKVWWLDRAATVVKLLFDQGTPAPLRRVLRQHSVTTTYELGWADLDNGSLLAMAESSFDALITTDKNLRYQQKLAGRRLAILVLPTANWPQLRVHEGKIAVAIDALMPGDFVEFRP
jgi:predicted nuclease of predicted toxin-antitoxin system